MQSALFNCARSDISHKEHIQLLLDEDMVDPWGMVADGGMDSEESLYYVRIILAPCLGSESRC